MWHCAASQCKICKKSAVDKESHKEHQHQWREPNAPKRSLSAFMHFFTSKHPKLNEEQPTLPFKFGDVGKEIGRRWKLVSD